MTLGSAFSIGLVGITGTTVTVEADVGRGLPGMYIGGLGDAAVGEAKERVKVAASNSGIDWPKTKVVVSLSPASLRKHGTSFDLAIVCAVLSATSNKPRIHERLRGVVLIGELGLDGSVRPVSGVLAAVMAAHEQGFREVIVPRDCGPEATLVDGICVRVVDSLAELWGWARGKVQLEMARKGHADRGEPALDMADVDGQKQARFTLEVAAAGGHHIFLEGSPGTGKSMLAARLPSILPPLGKQQQLEATAIHSLAESSSKQHIIEAPPFIAPHYTATAAALVGGGAIPRPGAVSLAHHGVLFLDEVTLMKPAVLDALRIPLETGSITHLRARQRVTFPAQTQLVMAANPCACGAAYPSECTCSAAVRLKYQRAVSGPLRDRIDLHCYLEPNRAVLGVGGNEPSAKIRERVIEARERAEYRWSAAFSEESQMLTNARVPGTLLRQLSADDAEISALLDYHLKSGSLSQRGIDKVLRVAWTIADLAAAPIPDFDQVMRAFELHDARPDVQAA